MAESAATKVTLRRSLVTWWNDNLPRAGFWRTFNSFLAGIWDFLRESTPEQRRRRYGDVEYDWDHRVDTTSATVSWRDRLLGVFHSAYQPTEPAAFHEMLESVRIDFHPFTFIDLGSGKGRTLMMASHYPFQKIIGVELLPDLHRIACQNLEKYRSADQRCFRLESVCADAREFPFPDEPLVLYLFNPLPEAGLSQVMRNLEESLRWRPRKVIVFYHNPLLEHVVASVRLRKTYGSLEYSVYEST